MITTMMQRLSIRRISSLARQRHFFSHCSSESTFRLLSHKGGDTRKACCLRHFSSISERDALALEEDVEKKMGWLLKLFFVGTAGFVGYQFFPYMGDSLLQQSISLLHVKDPLFKRMGASRISRYAIDDERRMKVVEMGGTQELLNMLEAAKDDLAARAMHEAGAVSIVSSAPESSEHTEVEVYKSSLLKRFQELEK